MKKIIIITLILSAGHYGFSSCKDVINPHDNADSRPASDEKTAFLRNYLALQASLALPGRRLSSVEIDAVLKAHLEGQKDEPHTEGIGNNALIWRKINILNDAGFSGEEIKILMNQGPAGE